ncbi:MAG: DNA polymerase III subunit delta [Thermodesulfovibrionales bacterium]
MSIFNFYKEIKKGLEGNYFLYSQEPFMLREAYEIFLTYIKDRGEDLSLKVLDMSEKLPISHVIEALKTPVFFGNKGWVVIKEAQLLKLKDLATLASLNFWEPYVLFLYNKNPEREIFNTLKEVKFISIELKEDEVLSWIDLKAKNLGIELNREAIEYLLEITEGEPGLIATELNKIAMAGIKNPSHEELKELIYAHVNYDTRDLINAIKKKDRIRTLYIIKSFKDNLPLAMGILNKIYSSSSDYKKALPLLHEMDLRSKAYKDFLEPLLLKLLELKAK